MSAVNIPDMVSVVRHHKLKVGLNFISLEISRQRAVLIDSTNEVQRQCENLVPAIL